MATVVVNKKYNNNFIPKDFKSSDVLLTIPEIIEVKINPNHFI